MRRLVKALASSSDNPSTYLHRRVITATMGRTVFVYLLLSGAETHPRPTQLEAYATTWDDVLSRKVGVAHAPIERSDRRHHCRVRQR